MRVLRILIWAVLTLAVCAARAACNDADGCPDPGPVIAANAELAKNSPVRVAELPAAAAPARVASAVSDGRPAGALVMRADPPGGGARAVKADRGRADPGSGGSEPSSVWLMLFSGLAFAGFVVAKRIRG
jgi:hypothetical protein